MTINSHQKLSSIEDKVGEISTAHTVDYQSRVVNFLRDLLESVSKKPGLIQGLFKTKKTLDLELYSQICVKLEALKALAIEGSQIATNLRADCKAVENVVNSIALDSVSTDSAGATVLAMRVMQVNQQLDNIGTAATTTEQVSGKLTIIVKELDALLAQGIEKDKLKELLERSI